MRFRFKPQLKILSVGGNLWVVRKLEVEGNEDGNKLHALAGLAEGKGRFTCTFSS